MKELARFEDIIEGVEAKFAQMAEFCIGTVRECTEGWFWEDGNRSYQYIPNFVSGEPDDPDCSAEGMEDVRVLQELMVREDGGVSGRRFIFDNGGLLVVLGIQLDAEQLTTEGAGSVINEVQALEVEVFGVPELTEADEKDFYEILDGALGE